MLALELNTVCNVRKLAKKPALPQGQSEQKERLASKDVLNIRMNERPVSSNIVVIKPDILIYASRRRNSTK